MKVNSSQPVKLEDLDLAKFQEVESKSVPRKSEPLVRAGTPPRAQMNIRQDDVATNTVKVSQTQAEPADSTDLASPPSLDSSYLSEGLPSNFIFYPFKTLRMRPFVPRDQMALWRGRIKGDTGIVADAMSATIQMDARQLTVPDFWYLMYQQRLASFKRSPFVVGPWPCVSDEHLRRIEEVQAKIDKPSEGDSIFDLKVELKRLKDAQEQTTTVTKSDLTIREIEPEAAEKVLALKQYILEEYGIEVVPVTMETLIASFEELEQMEQAGKERLSKLEGVAKEKAAIDISSDLEYVQFYNRYAGSISKRHGTTLKDRRAFLETIEKSDLLNDIDEFISLAEHGVDEKFKVRCKECGMFETVNQTIDIPHFFPKLK